MPIVDMTTIFEKAQEAMNLSKGKLDRYTEINQFIMIGMPMNIQTQIIEKNLNKILKSENCRASAHSLQLRDGQFPKRQLCVTFDQPLEFSFALVSISAAFSVAHKNKPIFLNKDRWYVEAAHVGHLETILKQQPVVRQLERRMQRT